MLLLGIDLGTSFVKVSVIDAATRNCIVTTSNMDVEAKIFSPQPGWAEQSPDAWWTYVISAIRKAVASGQFDPAAIGAIGIAYQMHGLVIVDKEQNAIRNSIIWCDSRAVEIGERAFSAIGKEKCLLHFLNAPGNFTASKLAWVKQYEPAVYEITAKAMLPGDFIAMKLTGEISTTPAALSEGICWDFKEEKIADIILDHFGFDHSIIPEVKPVFADHGRMTNEAAKLLGLPAGIPVSYKAGDQQNNALSLNVLEPGEVAASAGTSGVIYAVTDQLLTDSRSRVNSFAHVNHTKAQRRLGVLLCINGCGIMNRWAKGNMLSQVSYENMNAIAAGADIGSNGLKVLPFGNGAERMLENQTIGADITNLNLVVHEQKHVFRAVQEGIAFSFRYGLDIMRENGLHPERIKAGLANLFLSDVFAEAFVHTNNLELTLYRYDGSAGAAIGAGLGIGYYRNKQEAFTGYSPVKTIQPDPKLVRQYDHCYQEWKKVLIHKLKR